ncbi:hypothetical protein HMN09_00858700 [Mycena chlorophos]|uniref:HECT-type E3 ubiquitin transferase n=1 Tax=Mycena chlorophos TaxID=658473 RepID=A0A8H6ST11_MYCCL|nr:hypothetical protein HMN09_00858700 [Mycena chlorophos]
MSGFASNHAPDSPPAAQYRSSATTRRLTKTHFDRPSLLKTPSIMESVVGLFNLLATIPQPSLRFIVNILTPGECSAGTFQQSLALIQHLSYILDVIAQELKSRAQESGLGLYRDLVVDLRSSQGEAMVGTVASKFSPASSVQAKLLRLLRTIDYMYSPKSLSMTALGNASDGEADKVQDVYESLRFMPLWKRLYVGSKSTNSARLLRAASSPRSPTTPRESMEDLFVAFTDSHRKVLNLMVRNNPSLMSDSFSLLVSNPRVLGFDDKRNYFAQARVFEDSFQHLQRKTGDQIKYGKLSVRFYDEEGVDAGGVAREWFQILARQMFDPNNALFQPCAADRLTYQPNKNSWVNPEHLSFFKFVGRVIGKATYDGRLLDAYFARSLYRQLLGKPVDYKDNDPTPLELTFSVEADEFGVNRIVPLKEGGESLADQIESLSGGFYEIIPKELITIFNEQELELLISGTPDIDVGPSTTAICGETQPVSGNTGTMNPAATINEASRRPQGRLAEQGWGRSVDKEGSITIGIVMPGSVHSIDESAGEKKRLWRALCGVGHPGDDFGSSKACSKRDEWI